MAGRLLAKYATSPASACRKFPEPTSDDGLSEFQRDRNRILRCTAFRRLDYKTQVFAPHEHDLFRTRLTHTLEVAQVARDIARALDLCEDLVEAVALGHDLGHPPFGHVGERVLDELMSSQGHFEHNRQSLRIVDYLEHPYPQFRGLNLTDAVRECLAKHETKYDTPICDEFPANNTKKPPPMEGQVVELADEIAYTAADLEDALMSEWISTDDLAGLALWQRATRRAESTYPGARDIHIRIQAVQSLPAILTDDLLARTRANILAMGINSPQAEARCVRFSDELARELEQLQDFLLERVYRHEENLRHEEQARLILRELFQAFLTDDQLLPGRYRSRVDEPGSGENLHRVVCDYIAGMTDRFCKEAWEKMGVG
ncbi:MAG: deoxyguanosinetriphosphate triphosphohydrolase [Planctomycetota bacterium]|nr:MAG: deoxyguanosinetriphosphate triphosphohydrolase [Planctomycetota bacterium]